MSGRTVADVRGLILSCCEATGSTPVTGDLPDEFDLRAEGLVDSIGFVALLSELETRLGCQIDFDRLDPDDLTRIGPLARYIAERA